MGFLSSILGFDGTQSTSYKNGDVLYIEIYHDGVTFEFEKYNGVLTFISMSEGNTIPECVQEAAESEAFDND